jgi:O-antigen ligase
MFAKFQHVVDPRFALWSAAVALFVEAPILGHGARTYGILYQARLHDLDLPSWVFAEQRFVPWPHNLYLELLTEQGLVRFADHR